MSCGHICSQLGSNVRQQRELSDGERRHRANCSRGKLMSFSVSRSRSHGSIWQHLTTMIVPRPKLSSDRWTLSGPRVARNSEDRHTKFLQKTMEPEESGVHQYLSVVDDSIVTQHDCLGQLGDIPCQEGDTLHEHRSRSLRQGMPQRELRRRDALHH